MSGLIIRGGRVLDPASGFDAVADVFIADGRIRALGEQDLLAGVEQRLDARPFVGDHRRGAGCCLEQPDAGGVAGSDHGIAGDVERVALGAVEGAVFGGRHVLAVLDVAGPDDVGRILGPGHREAAIGPAASRFQQQSLNPRLAVAAVGAEIAEIPAGRQALGVVQLGVDGAVQRARAGRAQLLLQPQQGRAAGERQVELIARDLRRCQVVALAAGEPRQRHRRVDVVEGGDATGLRQYPVTDRYPVRHEGTDDDGIGRADIVAKARFQLVQALVEPGRAERWLREITVRGVPGDVALQKQHLVAGPCQFAHQSAVGGGVAVAPGRSDRQTQDDDLHTACLRAVAVRSRPSSTASSWAARWA